MDVLLSPAPQIPGPSKPLPEDARAVSYGDKQSYMESLKNEKDEWETFYKKSRRKRRKLLQQKEPTQKDKSRGPVPMKEMLHTLSEEDRMFLAERPDYDGFGRLLESVWKQNLCVLELKEKVDHSHRMVQEQCKALREKLVAHILRDKSD